MRLFFRNCPGSVALLAFKFLGGGFQVWRGPELGVFVALILSFSPVAGLRWVRAARFPTANVPKPDIGKRPSLRTLVWISSTKRSTMILACGLVTSELARSSIKSLFFMSIVGEQRNDGGKQGCETKHFSRPCRRCIVSTPQESNANRSFSVA